VTVDLVILGLVVLSAVWGAWSGVAKQIAHLASIALGYALARPAAALLGPSAARAFHVSKAVGLVAATVFAFVLIVVGVRIILTPLIRRILAANPEQDRSADRSLGFLLGGLKTAALAYVLVCALTFAEANVAIAGKPLHLSPQDSEVFALCREHNIFAWSHFGGVRDWISVAGALGDPTRRASVQNSAAFAELQKDPRFKSILGDRGLQKAFQTGNFQALVKDNALLDLMQDQAFMAKLKTAADAAQKRP